MFDLFQYGNDLFILFIFPLIGLLLDYYTSRKTTFYILIASFLLFIPFFTGYKYIINYSYQILAVLFLGGIYSLLSREIEKKIPKFTIPLIISGLLFIILSFASFMDSMSGYQKTEKEWKIDNYKIEYVCDQGFSGRPLLKYELSQYAFIPLFIRHVETAIAGDSGNCKIIFKESGISFNACEGKIIR